MLFWVYAALLLIIGPNFLHASELMPVYDIDRKKHSIRDYDVESDNGREPNFSPKIKMNCTWAYLFEGVPILNKDGSLIIIDDNGRRVYKDNQPIQHTNSSRVPRNKFVWYALSPDGSIGIHKDINSTGTFYTFDFNNDKLIGNALELSHELRTCIHAIKFMV